MRLVLDTNIVVSALLWGGTPHHLLAAIRRLAGAQLYSSPILIEELVDVLTRPSPAGRLDLIGKSAAMVLADYVEAVELIEPVEVPRVVIRDADDDQVLAVAVAARADLIVSGDRKHLLPIGNYQGIAIVEAGEALQRIRRAIALK